MFQPPVRSLTNILSNAPLGPKMDLAAMCDLFQHENAEILILDEQVARVGHYAELFFSYCFIDNELHSLNTFYQQQPLNYWNTEFRSGTVTQAFKGSGYSPQELTFLKRYAHSATGYKVAETLFLGCGGDPRVVSDGRRAYAICPVSDGTYKLHNLRERITLPIALAIPRSEYGKNWQPFLIGDELFMVHEMEPFRIIKLHTRSGYGEVVEEIEIDFNMPCIRSIEPKNYQMFRGGCNALSVGNAIFGVGRATSIGYRHSPFFWCFDAEGQFEVAFTDFFSEFYERGFRIIDPTCLFYHEDELYFGFCATERDWSHNQRVSHFLLVFRGENKTDQDQGLLRYFESRRKTEQSGTPNLDQHMFLCVEMPSDIAHGYENAGRSSTGASGHLVRGPDVEIKKEAKYCAELSYLTQSCQAEQAGIFEIIFRQVNNDGEASQEIVAGCVEIAPTDNEMAEVRIEFDTSGFFGWLIETRISVEQDVILNAFHVRTWRCGAKTSQSWDFPC